MRPHGLRDAVWPSRRARAAGHRSLAFSRSSVDIISPVDSRVVDDVLARLGRQRRVVLNVPHWLVVPEVLPVTDLAAVMPERLALALASPNQGFMLHELPFETTAFEWALYWHSRHEGSAEHTWFASCWRRQSMRPLIRPVTSRFRDKGPSPMQRASSPRMNDHDLSALGSRR